MRNSRVSLTMILLRSGICFSEECLLNLAQAVGPDQINSAYRVVGTRRIVVEPHAQKFRVLLQCRSHRRWMISDHGGGVRYLNGVLRNGDGSWVVASGDLTALESVAHCLPAAYEHLLTPDSDDWYPLRAKKAG